MWSGVKEKYIYIQYMIWKFLFWSHRTGCGERPVPGRVVAAVSVLTPTETLMLDGAVSTCFLLKLAIKINSILEIMLSVHTLLLNKLNQHGILGSGPSWHAQIMSYFPVPWNMFDEYHSLPSRWSFQQPLQWHLLWKQHRIWDWVQEFGQLHPLQQVHHQGLPDCPLIFPAAPFPLFLQIWAGCWSLRAGAFALKHTTKMACAFEVSDWHESCILSFLVAECVSGSYCSSALPVRNQIH